MKMKTTIKLAGISTAKEQQKAMTLVITRIKGVDMISFDMESKMLKVMGDIEPGEVFNELNKKWVAEISQVASDQSPSCVIL